MKCRTCGFPETKVLESRESKEGLTIRRRRECVECGFRFTTFEKSEDMPITVLKKSGVRVLFAAEKLFRSLSLACQKRAIQPENLQDIVDKVERRAFLLDSREITTSEIGDIALESLRKLDAVAYVRFASVYRAFSTPDDFVSELKNLATTLDAKDKV